jgi:thymidylate kinase
MTTIDLQTNPLLVLEGNCGVGKSTLSSLVAETMDASMLHFPPTFVHFRQAIDLDRNVGAWARLAYYLGASIHLAELASVALVRGALVCDRYWASPFSLLEAEGLLPASEIDAFIAPFRRLVPLPAITLHLTATHAEAARRVLYRARGRTLTRDEEWTVESERFFKARASASRQRSAALGPVIDIDTTHLAPVEVRAAAMRAIHNHVPVLEKT